MAVSVRDTLERLGHEVGYDKKNGGVLVKDKNGREINIGSEGFTLGDDNRYYAESADKVYNLLTKNGLSAGKGWSAVRNTLTPTESVGYNAKSGQLSVNGREYNIDNENLVNVDGTIYGKSDFVSSLKRKPYTNNYEALEKKVLARLAQSSYDGYDPENDENYQNAYSDYVKNAKSDMGARGLTSDSLISHYASQGAKKLLPEYAKADYERYKDDNDRMRSLLYTAKNLDDSARQTYETNETASNNAAKLEAQNRQATLDEMLGDMRMAVQRSEINGFVSESDAPFLGVSAGTPTYEAQESINKRLFEVSQLKLKSDLEMENYSKKSSIDEDADNRAAERDHAYDIEMLDLSTDAEKEIARLQNDLDISKAQAVAYYKMIY